MPILQLPLPTHPSISLLSWHLTNDFEPFAETGILEKKRESRAHQDMAKDMLITKAFGMSMEVNFFDSGKPKPINGQHVSFSHSRDHIVLATGLCNVGIDLQYYTDKLLRVSHKFVSDFERTLLHSDPKLAAQQIHFLWCAKEAIFKIYGSNLPFKDIEAQSLELANAGSISCRVPEGKLHQVAYCFFDDFCFCLAT